MKTRETKQRDLETLTQSLQGAKSAMVVSFSKLTVNKDIEFRNSLREAGARYQVVKNTLARIAAKDTQFEQAVESFKGVSAIAWTENDPVILSKAVSKFMKDNADIYTFKSGVVDGRLIDFTQVQSIASLPSKEELISKLLWVINAQAERLVTVINAVPRNLAVVIKLIGEKAPAGESEVKAEASAESAPAEAAPTEASAEAAPAETAPAEAAETAPAEAAPGEAAGTAPAAETTPAAEEAPAAEASTEDSPDEEEVAPAATEGDEKAE